MRVLVLGHRGMVGRAVCREVTRDPNMTLLVDTAKFDLRGENAMGMILDRARRVDAIVLAAARVGGIQANSDRPWDFVHDNVRIQTNVMSAARQRGIGKLIFLGSTCVYPRLAESPIPEIALLTGPLEPTNRAYAVAKLAGIEMVMRMHEMGSDWLTLMPANLYGPHDNFEPGGHVVAELMRKFRRAQGEKDAPATVWGDPKWPTFRELLYVEDFAQAVHRVLASHRRPQWIYNVGSGAVVSIPDLARTIQKVTGHTGSIVWDTSAPTGAPVRALNFSRFEGDFEWAPETSLLEGLRRTWRWYLAQEGETE